MLGAARRRQRCLLDELENQGMGCIVFTALAQGLLTDRYLDGVPSDSRAARSDSTIVPPVGVVVVGGFVAATGSGGGTAGRAGVGRSRDSPDSRKPS